MWRGGEDGGEEEEGEEGGRELTHTNCLHARFSVHEDFNSVTSTESDLNQKHA